MKKITAFLVGLLATASKLFAQPMPAQIGPAMRIKFRDVAFQFRMGSGFPGDVNRTHPASIEPVLIDGNAPPTVYGQAVLVDGATAGIRPFAAADQSDVNLATPYGAIVRPYPLQQVQGTNYGQAVLGAATPPTSGGADVLRSGYIMGQLNVGVAAPVKGGRVYVWCAVTAGNHIQGGYETQASAGNTVEFDPHYTYNGPADANGVVEIAFNV